MNPWFMVATSFQRPFGVYDVVFAVEQHRLVRRLH